MPAVVWEKFSKWIFRNEVWCQRFRAASEEQRIEQLHTYTLHTNMSGSLTHVLFEGPSGYALFTVNMQEEIGAKSKQMQDTVNDINIFNRMVQLASFVPFTSAAQALENANDVSEGILNPHLKSLLNMIVPGSGKGNKKQSEVVLAVSERGLAGSIQGEMGIMCDTSERSLELVRGVRLHQEKLLASGGMQKGDVAVAQLGLGHSYSRGKVKVCVPYL